MNYCDLVENCREGIGFVDFVVHRPEIFIVADVLEHLLLFGKVQRQQIPVNKVLHSLTQLFSTGQLVRFLNWQLFEGINYFPLFLL